MENKNIIIALLMVIVVLAIVVGVMFTQTMNAKEPTKLMITSNKTLNEGDSLILQLMDLNKTGISKQKVTVSVKDNNGKTVVNKTVETNSNGNAKLDLDLKKGKYIVNVTYGGDENYTGSNASQNLTVKEVVTEMVSSNSDSSSQSEEREEYQITPDGWNPREHEVSRESIGKGNERVRYDDGYFTVVDSNGNILTHGWT